MTNNQIEKRFTALFPRLLQLYHEGTELLADEQLRLAEAVDAGLYGLSTDPALAGRLVEEAARRGHTLAMVEMMARSLEREGDLGPETKGWIKRAAEAGDVEAIFTLGVSLITGQGGFEIDTAKGWKLIDTAADRFHPEALFQVAVEYLRGSEYHPKNPVFAKYYELAALNAGSERAQESINHFFNTDDLGSDGETIDADRVVDNAAAAGCAEAQLELANRIFVDATKKSDSSCPSETVELWLLKAADGGSVDAMCNLAETFDASGRTDEARFWLERGVKANYHAAKGLLAKALLQSDDRTEHERGRRLLIEALDFGFAPAQQTLAQQIKEGKMADLPGNVRSELYDTLFWESFNVGR